MARKTPPDTSVTQANEIYIPTRYLQGLKRSPNSFTLQPNFGVDNYWLCIEESLESEVLVGAMRMPKQKVR